jgi:CAAX protease family protein
MGIFYLFLSFYIGALIYLANKVEIDRHVGASPGGEQRFTLVRWMLFGVIAVKFLSTLVIVQLAYVSSSTAILKQLDIQPPSVDPNAALLNFALMLVVGYVCFQIILSDAFRQQIRRLVGSTNLYNPGSSIHMVALVLLLCFTSFVLDQVVENQVGSGGSISVLALALQDFLLVMGTFLGIGMAIRRNLPQSLERLGLQIPTLNDITWGIGSGLLLIGATLLMVQIWSLFVPINQIEQQNAAADEMVKSFNTLPLAFLLSFMAAVSEEILFRGALQPVFGLVPAGIFFALSHVQYALTPVALIIFVVGLGLGWLRRRRNTTSAILAHFVYDFVQLAIQIMVVQAGGG